MDFVSKLMGNDPGGRTFFASCLLCLNPEELKACRLVNSIWAKFIMDEVWKRSRERKRLEGKLVQMWKNTDPRTVELGQTRGRVSSMFCNDAFVFCGLQRGKKVGVYSFTTGQWVRDLMLGEGGWAITFQDCPGARQWSLLCGILLQSQCGAARIRWSSSSTSMPPTTTAWTSLASMKGQTGGN